MSIRIRRSTFIKGVAGLSIAGVAGKLGFDKLHGQKFPCRILGPSRQLGHMLRDGRLSVPADAKIDRRTRVTIVGGGIAGLSAAWWLKKHGFSEFVLLELEKQVGGNAASGKNEISAYPWGAHYVPLANAESEYVRALFDELGIIEGFDANGLPVYNELYLCHDPQERLLKDGAFQEGLVPKRGLQPEDKKEIDRFFQTMIKFRGLIGKDGKPAFAIPMDLSSRDEEIKALDKMSMADWLRKNDYKSTPLLWYVNYCCRDDYGSTLDKVSAWAGVHYFAGRRGKASNAEMNSVVTWPEGNGFLVDQLRNKVADHVTTGSMVIGMRAKDGKMLTHCVSADQSKHSCIESEYVVFAAPRFLSKYLLPDYAKELNFSDLQYAPWLVANISLASLPSARGMDIAWDNVSYRSDTLGYVVATHQDITTRPGRTVITFYYPLSNETPQAGRTDLQSASAEKWSKFIVDDLSKMHPGIEEEILSMDIWPWGHGMIRPSVGFVWGETRRKMLQPAGGGKIFFAHSDMSGISNFEEAQYHGVRAADKILALMKTV